MPFLLQMYRPLSILDVVTGLLTFIFFSTKKKYYNVEAFGLEREDFIGF